MTNEVATARVQLWLSWLELPWDVVSLDLKNEMRRVGMSHEDLAFELRTSGYKVSHKTIGNWLGNEQVRTPTMEALKALVEVFARVSVGDWAKGACLSQDGVTYLPAPDGPTPSPLPFDLVSHG